jgi:mRNA-degrading endonuclease RelE of RelBE toxin-antitoxin system
LEKINIFYKESVEKDLKKFAQKIRKSIHDKIEEELGSGFKGKKLKGNFRDLYSYWIGYYRVIYALIPDGILILKIGDRT